MEKTKKTILYLITQSEWGGAQRYCFDLASTLKNDFHVSVAFGEPGKQGELALKLEQEGLQNFFLPHLKRKISPINDLIAFFEIIKLIRRINPDVVHLNSSKISILGSLACFTHKLANSKSLKNLKIIYTVHGWVFNEPLPFWQKFFYKHAERLTSAFKNKIICVSNYDTKTAIKEKMADPKKLVTINNGLAPLIFLPKNEVKIKITNDLGIPSSHILCVSISNLYKTKGLEHLIGAAQYLVQKGLPVSFVVIGEGGERFNLENLIKLNKLEDRFFLYGSYVNASRLLKGFDIYASSSVKEGFPYSILEAMSAYLPIVTTNVGGIPELIENKKEGLLVRPGDAKILAEAIEKIVNDLTFGKKMGEQAEKKVDNCFSLEKMVTETKKIYL